MIGTRRRRRKGKASAQEPTEDVTVADDVVERKTAKRGGAKKKSQGTGRPVKADVDNCVAGFVKNTTTLGVSGLRKQFAELKTFIPEDYRFEAFTANMARNRYKDVVCLDATRIVLTLNVPPETDYVHASWVKMDKVDKTFIATQAPLEPTIQDFWRLCFQENVTTIIMLCKVIEDGKAKCTQYWPPEQGSYKNYGSMFVNNKKVENEDKFVTYTLEILPDGCSNSNIVKLIHMMDWPDRGVPSSGLTILRLLRLIIPGGPCVVHCSAGIGRTGTVIAIESIVQRLWKSVQVDLKDVLQELRRQRASSIQTEAQYVFVVSTVLDYIKAKMPQKYKDVCANFHEEVKKAGMT